MKPPPGRPPSQRRGADPDPPLTRRIFEFCARDAEGAYRLAIADGCVAPVVELNNMVEGRKVVVQWHRSVEELQRSLASYSPHPVIVADWFRVNSRPAPEGYFPVYVFSPEDFRLFFQKATGVPSADLIPFAP